MFVLARYDEWANENNVSVIIDEEKSTKAPNCVHAQPDCIIHDLKINTKLYSEKCYCYHSFGMLIVLLLALRRKKV